MWCRDVVKVTWVASAERKIWELGFYLMVIQRDSIRLAVLVLMIRISLPVSRTCLIGRFTNKFEGREDGRIAHRPRDDYQIESSAKSEKTTDGRQL